MAQVNYNLLQTSPADVGEAWSGVVPAAINGYRQGQQYAQQQQLNSLALQKAQRADAQQQMEMNALAQSGGDPQSLMGINPERGQKLMQNKQGMQEKSIEMQIKGLKLSKAVSDIVAGSPDGQVLQTALLHAKKVAEVTGAAPEQLQQAIQHIQAVHAEKGDQGLREEAAMQAISAQDRMSKIQYKDAGDRIVPVETNPNAPGYKGEEIKKGIAPSSMQQQNYAPSNLGKMVEERQALLDQGVFEDDPRVRAYDAKLFENEVDPDTMSEEEIGTWGKLVSLTGKMPPLGRGKASTAARLAIAKSAARQALGADQDGIPDEPNKTPAEAAFTMLQEQSDTKSIQGSLNFLDKQVSAMGSFVNNITLQINEVGELAEDLKTFDSRLLNVPLRVLRGRIQGSALQAKYDMYLTEIESEIGKLSTGSSASIAELSTSAQEKWAKIHDKALSTKDMLELLRATQKAANMRLQSVHNELASTRSRMVNRKPKQTESAAPVQKKIGRFLIEEVQ